MLRKNRVRLFLDRRKKKTAFQKLSGKSPHWKSLLISSRCTWTKTIESKNTPISSVCYCVFGFVDITLFSIRPNMGCQLDWSKVGDVELTHCCANGFWFVLVYNRTFYFSVVSTRGRHFIKPFSHNLIKSGADVKWKTDLGLFKDTTFVIKWNAYKETWICQFTLQVYTTTTRFSFFCVPGNMLLCHVLFFMWAIREVWFPGFHVADAFGRFWLSSTVTVVKMWNHSVQPHFGS